MRKTLWLRCLRSTRFIVYTVVALIGSSCHAERDLPSATSATLDDDPALSVIYQANSTITYVGVSVNHVNSSTTLVLARPAGVQQGDVMIAQVGTVGAYRVNTPGGWTLVRGDYDGSNSNSYLYWKRAGPSEPSSYSWTIPGSSQMAGGIVAYRNVIASGSPIDAHGGRHNAASTSIVAPSITTTTAGTYLVAIFSAASKKKEVGLSFTPPAGMVERYDRSSTAGGGSSRNAVVTHASAALGAAGATGTRTATLSASRPGWGQLVALKPAAAPEPPRVSTVRVAPSTHTFTAFGQTQQFTATALDSQGNTIAGVSFTWSSSASTVVNVNANGLATAQGSGTAMIVARTGDVQGSASATVALVAEPTVAWVWSGAQSSHGATIKVRLTGASSRVRIRVSADSLFGSYTETAMASTAGNDVATFVLSGLTANTRYHYRAGVGSTFDTGKQGAFRTLGTAGSAYSFTFAVGSCQRTGSNKAVYGHIRATNPLFWLQIGDLFYEDIVTNSIDLFRFEYNRVHGQSNQAALFRSVPIAYMWDDHDGGGGNDGDRTGTGWPAARAAYRENVPHHALALGPGGAIYHSFVVGRVRFIVTDLRGERSPRGDWDDVNKTMMGSAQKQWFKNELQTAKTNRQFVAWISTLPWIAARATAADHWGGYDTERHELATFIRNLGIGGQMFQLSGDMHGTAIDSGINNAWGGFPVFIAGPIDQGQSVKGGPYSHGTFTNSTLGEQFGTVTISDSGSSTIQVTFSGRRNGSEIPGANYQFTRTLSAP